MTGEIKSVYAILPYIVLFSFLSMFGVTFGYLTYGIYNDEIFFNLQNVSESLSDRGIISSQSSNLTLESFESYQNIASNIDDWWFVFYLMFLASTLLYSYIINATNDIGFMSFVFYGIMMILFILGLVDLTTTWWQDQILNKLLPNAMTNMPKFTWYLDNIGIINLLHILGCLVVNKMDLDFDRLLGRKNKELKAIEDSEVL